MLARRFHSPSSVSSVKVLRLSYESGSDIFYESQFCERALVEAVTEQMKSEASTEGLIAVQAPVMHTPPHPPTFEELG